jgi:hypothetical protein
VIEVASVLFLTVIEPASRCFVALALKVAIVLVLKLAIVLALGGLIDPGPRCLVAFVFSG